MVIIEIYSGNLLQAKNGKKFPKRFEPNFLPQNLKSIHIFWHFVPHRPESLRKLKEH